MIKGCELFRLFHHVKQIVYSHLHCEGGKRWPPKRGLFLLWYFQRVRYTSRNMAEAPVKTVGFEMPTKHSRWLEIIAVNHMITWKCFKDINNFKKKIPALFIIYWSRQEKLEIVLVFEETSAHILAGVNKSWPSQEKQWNICFSREFQTRVVYGKENISLARSLYGSQDFGSRERDENLRRSIRFDFLNETIVVC